MDKLKHTQRELPMIKILAIDDNADNLVVLKAMLTATFPDVEYSSAQTGIEGITLARNEQFDVILLDLVMPGIDGFEICRTIKEDPDFHRIPVIILTAERSDSSSRIKALQLGADSFLTKPVVEAELIAVVSTMVRIKRSEDLVRQEKEMLEIAVAERTEMLQLQLEELKRTERELKSSFRELEKTKMATMNLLEDLKSEIDQRKAAEEGVIKLNEELEQRVMERTIQFEEANKELEAFSYSVSHDLRAPLRAIDGFTRILFEDYFPFLDDEGKRVCGVIQENAIRMGQLIDDLLAFSRLNRTELHFTKINMELLAKNVFAENTNDEEKQKIDLKFEHFFPGMGDPVLLRQVLVNIVGNA
ncbi:MAG: response regulator, partial [Bacteroidales bacterium]|nr:response regulator [Bacteroidales bacterium]